MKRNAEGDAPFNSRKRRKSESREPDTPATTSEAATGNPFDPSLEVDARVLRATNAQNSGYIEGEVVMRFPPSNSTPKLRLVLRVKDALRLEVVISGPCSKDSRLLDIKIRDVAQLTLRGALVENTTARPNHLPIVVKYQDGVLVRIVHSPNEAKVNQVIDTWPIKQHQSAQPSISMTTDAHDDWFTTPTTGPRYTLVIDASSQSNDRQKDTGAQTPAAVLDESAPAVATISDPVHVRVAGSLANSPDDSSERRESPEHTSSCIEPRPNAGVNTEAFPPNFANSRRSAVSCVDSRHLKPLRPDVTVENTLEPTVPVVKRGIPLQQDNTTNLQESDSSPRARAKKTEKNRLRRAKRKERLQDIYGNLSESADARDSTPSVEGAQCPDRVEATKLIISLTSEAMSDAPGSDQARPEAHDHGIEAQQVPGGIPSSIPEGTVKAEDMDATIMQKAGVNLQDKPAPSAPIHSPLADSSHSESATAKQVHKSDKTPNPETNSVDNRSELPSRKIRIRSNLTMMEPEATSPSLNAGCVTEAGTYLPLDAVPDRQSIKIMGVVTSTVGPKTTRNEEFSISIRMVDPSIYSTRDFTVNCFAKQRDLLPEPAIGDVALFRDVQGSEWDGKKSATGPSFKQWRWSIYEPRTGKVARPNSHTENPIYFQPFVSELQYCMRLADWWRDIASQGEDDAVVHHIQDQDSYRRHRLISEASPYAEPDGYFDCTVEVLKGFQNDNGIYTLYVTDYTVNDQLTHANWQWCPPALAQRVLKIEMWDAAAEVGPNMKPGEFYSIRNVRMRLSAGSSWEAKFVEGKKIRRLDEHYLDGETDLIELLKRKEAWKEESTKGDTVPQFPHLLFENVEEDKHFCCTAEVIDISRDNGPCNMYVTDYTSRPDLSPVAPSVTRLAAHKDRVVRITLSEAQAETAKSLKPGDFISIRNLRMRRSGTKQLSGRLGGEQRLINKLLVSGDNEELKALLQRKRHWETQVFPKSSNGQDVRKSLPSVSNKKTAHLNGSNAETFHSAKPPTRDSQPKTSSIEEVCKSNRLDVSYRIHARIVDFNPEAIKEFTVRRCIKCRKSVPDSHRICFACIEDMLEETVQPEYHFWLGVEDEAHDQLEILVCNPECSLLKGLKLADLKEDSDAAEALVERLRPLSQSTWVKDGDTYKQDRFVNQHAPMLQLDIRGWNVEDEYKRSKRSYVLLHHAVLK